MKRISSQMPKIILLWAAIFTVALGLSAQTPASAVDNPELALGQNWFRYEDLSNSQESYIGTEKYYHEVTKVVFTKTFDTSKTVTAEWNADSSRSGSIVCRYVESETTLYVVLVSGTKIKVSSAPTNTYMLSFGTSSESQLTSFEGLDLLDTSSATTFSYWFRYCSVLTGLDIPSWDASSCQSMTSMFRDCTALTSVNLSALQTTSELRNVADMFRNCSNLTVVDLSSFNLTNVTSYVNCFSGASELHTVKLPSTYSANTLITALAKTTYSWYRQEDNEVYAYNTIPSGAGTYIYGDGLYHTFNYSADGATITAFCERTECALADHKRILTLSTPNKTWDSTVYNGASVSNWDYYKNDIYNQNLTQDLKYYSTTTAGATSGGTLLPGAPTDAGSYYAELTLGGVKAASAFQITRIPVTHSSTDLTVNYNELTSGQVALSSRFTPDIHAGTATYSLVTASSTGTGTITGSTLTVTKAGTFTVKLSTAVNGAYDAGEKTCTITVTKGVQTVTAPTAKTGLIFNGTSQALLNAGTCSGTALQYSLSFGTGYGTTIPSESNAGTYTVWYKAPGTDVYQEVAPQSISVTIAKAQPTVTAPVPISLTYTGEPQALVTAGSTSGGTMEYALSQVGPYANTLPTAVNADTYDVWYRVTGNGNYVSTAPAKVSVTMTKAQPTVTAPTARFLTYSGTSQALVNAGGTSGGTMEYALSQTGPYSTGIPTSVNADTYEVWYRVTGDANHENAAAAKVDVTIAKAEITLTAPTAAELTYTGTAQELVTAGTVSAGTLQYAQEETGPFATTIPTGTNAGTYTVWYKTEGGANYLGTTPQSISVTIDKAQPEVLAPTARTLAYTGTTQELVTAGTTSGGTLEYALAENGPYTETIPTAIEHGTYTVWYRVDGGDNYSDVSAQSVTVILTKVLPTYTVPQAKELTYNGTEQELLEVTETVHGTMIFSLQENEGYTTAIPTGMNAGRYDVWFRIVAEDGYENIGPTRVIVTIHRKENKILYLSMEDWKEGETASKPKATAEYGVPSFSYATSMDGTYESAVPTAAGYYYVKASVGTSTNYMSTSKTASFVIRMSSIRNPITLDTKGNLADDTPLTLDDIKDGIDPGMELVVRKEDVSQVTKLSQFLSEDEMVYAAYDATLRLKGGNQTVAWNGETTVAITIPEALKSKTVRILQRTDGSTVEKEVTLSEDGTTAFFTTNELSEFFVVGEKENGTDPSKDPVVDPVIDPNPPAPPKKSEDGQFPWWILLLLLLLLLLVYMILFRAWKHHGKEPLRFLVPSFRKVSKLLYGTILNDLERTEEEDN